MMRGYVKFQIGKQGLTPGVIESLKLAFKTHHQIRISVLKSACRDRAELEKLADEIKNQLPFKTVYRLIGYTIILKN